MAFAVALSVFLGLAAIVVFVLGMAAVVAFVDEDRHTGSTRPDNPPASGNDRLPWWSFGGNVVLTLRLGAISFIAGLTGTVLARAVAPWAIASASITVVGALLMLAGELTRHRVSVPPMDR